MNIYGKDMENNNKKDHWLEFVQTNLWEKVQKILISPLKNIDKIYLLLNGVKSNNGYKTAKKKYIITN